jgi:hypothetical protein
MLNCTMSVYYTCFSAGVRKFDGKTYPPETFGFFRDVVTTKKAAMGVLNRCDEIGRIL